MCAHKQGEQRTEGKGEAGSAGSLIWGSIPRLWDHDLSQRQTLNWLSHPGTPNVFSLKCNFICSLIGLIVYFKVKSLYLFKKNQIPDLPLIMENNVNNVREEEENRSLDLITIPFIQKFTFLLIKAASWEDTTPWIFQPRSQHKNILLQLKQNWGNIQTHKILVKNWE